MGPTKEMQQAESSAYWNDQKYKTFTEWHKRFLSSLSIFERKRQFQSFWKICEPEAESTVLDVGFSAAKEVLPDTNLFEKIYPYQERITAATVEDVDPATKAQFPKLKLIKIIPNHRLPFRDGEFDISTAWATLEHVGDYEKQKAFLKEVFRVGKAVYLTTPYRGAIYEPHSGVFFLHWLPMGLFRNLLRKIGKEIWADVANLNPLFVSDVRKMIGGIEGARIKVHFTLGVVPSHLIIYREKA